MNEAVAKALTFLLFIGVGLLLRLKLKKKEEVQGIKVIILNLALPATIFIALLTVEIDLKFLLLPVIALAFNGLLYLFAAPLLSALGIEKNTPTYRTARLLIPSLAPGLSCFPFILEYLGEGFLAKAAMADLGNKVFVLLILYIVALHWHNKNPQFKGAPMGSRMKAMLKTLITEPVNLFIFAALIFMGFGIQLHELPDLIGQPLSRLSLIMTPLVLLFIGLSVKTTKTQFVQLFSLLMGRAAIVLMISGSFVWLTGLNASSDALLAVCFSLSACSFWPYAHISLVNAKEKELTAKTFDTNYAVSILALSLPLSVGLILFILSAGTTFSNVQPIFLLAFALFVLGALPTLLIRLRSVFAPSHRAELEGSES